MNIGVRLFSEKAKTPQRATTQAAGWDVTAIQRTVIPCGNWQKVSLGIGLELPVNSCALLLGRSGMAAKHGVLGKTGLIDSDYRGKLYLTLHNVGVNDYVIHEGDRIGQLLFLKLPSVKLQQVPVLSKTVRGTGGFGSTGK